MYFNLRFKLLWNVILCHIIFLQLSSIMEVMMGEIFVGKALLSDVAEHITVIRNLFI